jgi:hypothetical protein
VTVNPDRGPRPVRSPADWRLSRRLVAEARSAGTSPDRLRELASEDFRPVRLWVARHPRTPQDALAELCRDPDRTVVWNAMWNPSTPGDVLRRLADAEHRRVGMRGTLHRGVIVHHPNTPDDLRSALAAAGVCGCPGPCFSRSRFAAAR